MVVNTCDIQDKIYIRIDNRRWDSKAFSDVRGNVISYCAGPGSPCHYRPFENKRTKTKGINGSYRADDGVPLRGDDKIMRAIWTRLKKDWGWTAEILPAWVEREIGLKCTRHRLRTLHTFKSFLFPNLLLTDKVDCGVLNLTSLYTQCVWQML